MAAFSGQPIKAADVLTNPVRDLHVSRYSFSLGATGGNPELGGVDSAIVST